MFNRSGLLPLFVLPGLLGACDLYQTEPGDIGPRCIETPTVISADELTALGFSGEDIIAMASGQHVMPIHWHAIKQDGLLDATVGPEAGEGELSVTLAHAGGEIRYIERAPEFEWQTEEAAACSDRLEVDMTLSITTAGGALNETVGTTLRAMDVRFAEGSATLDLGNLGGSLAVEVNSQKLKASDAVFEFGVSEHGITGALNGMFEWSDGDVHMGTNLNYATFPEAERTCEPGDMALPLDVPFVGVSGQDVLDLTVREDAFQIIWQDTGDGMGKATDLTVTPRSQWACQSMGPAEPYADDEPSLRVKATASIVSQEAGVDLSVPVLLLGQSDDGGETLAQTSMGIDGNRFMVEPGEFEAAFGTMPVDVSGYDYASLEFHGSFVDAPERGSADGSLAVTGWTMPPCADEPGAPCAGGDPTELIRAYWGNVGL